MRNKKIFNEGIKYIKNKKLEKQEGAIPLDAVACGIATLKPVGKYLEIVKDSDAICVPMGDIVCDILLDNFHAYKVFEGLDAIRNAYETGKLQPNESFCYSSYNCHQIFDALKFQKTKDEAKEYLKAYNKTNNTTLYWTFLDEDELKEVNEIVDNNEKKYSKLRY